MSFLSRLLSPRETPRDALRPLWHRVVEVSREPEWYADCGALDSVEGRFDMITVVLALVLLRMEASEELGPDTALLTELFVADMDRQLRDTGVGDLMVGKKIIKLMGALGGRTGALREIMTESDAELAKVLTRNVTLAEGAPRFAMAVRVRALAIELATQSDAAIRAGSLRP
jgi:cytochrome b pre-mRNA-processing protein 3